MVIRRIFLFAILIFCCTSAFGAGGPPPVDNGTPATGNDVALLIAYILLALIFSFLCSVAEAVLLSITPSYIAGLQETHPKRAELLKKLRQDNIDRSLAAILTLNTIAHTVGAIGSGSKATAVFGSAWFGVFSAVMTLMILFLSEIIPKTIGALYWRSLATSTAYFVNGLTVLLLPLVWISEWLTRLVSGGKSTHVFNREEFVALASIGEEKGQIKEDESRIIRNLFKLESLVAKDVMTPRTVIEGLQQDLTAAEALEDAKTALRFSRLPIYAENLDEITGFVLKDDVLLAKAENRGDLTLNQLKRDLKTVPGSVSLSELLEFLLNERLHIALVVDEYGGTYGLVTLEDVVETLLGMEIVDEVDGTDDMQHMARRQWERRASALGIEIEPEPGTEHKDD